MGVFARFMLGLAAETPDKTISIDATCLEAHRTASSLWVKKGAWTSDRSHQRRYEYETACHDWYDWAAYSILHHRWSGQSLIPIKHAYEMGTSELYRTSITSAAPAPTTDRSMYPKGW